MIYIPSSFSSTFSSAAGPAAAVSPPLEAIAPPPDGTDASLLEPWLINYSGVRWQYGRLLSFIPRLYLCLSAQIIAG